MCLFWSERSSSRRRNGIFKEFEFSYFPVFNLVSEVSNLFLLLTVFACVKIFRPVVIGTRAPSKLRKKKMQKITQTLEAKKSGTVGGNRKNPEFRRSNKDIVMFPNPLAFGGDPVYKDMTIYNNNRSHFSQNKKSREILFVFCHLFSSVPSLRVIRLQLDTWTLLYFC